MSPEGRKAVEQMTSEWTMVPMMPTHELWQRSWRNIVDRAREKFGSAAVDEAIDGYPTLANLQKSFSCSREPQG